MSRRNSAEHGFKSSLVSGNLSVRLSSVTSSPSTTPSPQSRALSSKCSSGTTTASLLPSVPTSPAITPASTPSSPTQPPFFSEKKVRKTPRQSELISELKTKLSGACRDDEFNSDSLFKSILKLFDTLEDLTELIEKVHKGSYSQGRCCRSSAERKLLEAFLKRLKTSANALIDDFHTERYREDSKEEYTEKRDTGTIEIGEYILVISFLEKVLNPSDKLNFCHTLAFAGFTTKAKEKIGNQLKKLEPDFQVEQWIKTWNEGKLINITPRGSVIGTPSVSRYPTPYGTPQKPPRRVSQQTSGSVSSTPSTRKSSVPFLEVPSLNLPSPQVNEQDEEQQSTQATSIFTPAKT